MNGSLVGVFELSCSVLGCLVLLAAIHFTFSKITAGWWLVWWKLRYLILCVGGVAVASGFLSGRLLHS